MNIKGLLAIALLATLTYAKEPSKITITTSSYQEVVKKDENGKLKKVWVKATKVVPGTVVKYINEVKNNSDTPLENVVVTNQIDPNLEYVKNSATSKGVEVKFRVKGSKEFKKPNELYIVNNGKKRLALPKEYRAIRWSINKLKPKSTFKLEYKAKLK